MTTESEARAEAERRHAKGELYDLTKSRVTTFVEGALWAASRREPSEPVQGDAKLLQNSEPSDTDEREWEYGVWKPWGGGAFKPAFDLGYARFMVAHDIRYKGWDVVRSRKAGPLEVVPDGEWQGYCDRGSCCLELNHEGKCKQ